MDFCYVLLLFLFDFSWVGFLAVLQTLASPLVLVVLVFNESSIYLIYSCYCWFELPSVLHWHKYYLLYKILLFSLLLVLFCIFYISPPWFPLLYIASSWKGRMVLLALFETIFLYVVWVFLTTPTTCWTSSAPLLVVSRFFTFKTPYVCRDVIVILFWGSAQYLFPWKL